MSKNAANAPKKVKTLTLEDGRTLQLKNLKLAPLRRFMVRFSDLDKLDGPDSVAIMDILGDCAAIALRTQLPEETKFLDKEVEDRTEEDREAFGELLDMDDIHLVNREMGGVSFGGGGEGNLQTEEPETVTPEAEESGATSTSTDSSQS